MNDAHEAAASRARHERRQSLGKDLYKRMKTALKGRKPSSNQGPSSSASVSGPQETSIAAAEPLQDEFPLHHSSFEFAAPFLVAASSDSEPTDPPATITAVATSSTATTTTTSTYPSSIPTETIFRPPLHPRRPSSTQQAARARALFERYGLSFDDAEWAATPASTEVQRVEKRIRMRVHRSCHRCEVPFGAGRECRNCDHTRCKRCPRYPPARPATTAAASEPCKDGDEGGRDGRPEGDRRERRRIADGEGRGKERENDAMDVVGSDGGATTTTPTTRKHGAALQPTLDNVPKAKAHRVHRWCHKCDEEFPALLDAACSSCGHARCSRCPKTPAKKRKLPGTSPASAPVVDSGDDSDADSNFNPGEARLRMHRTYKKTRQRVRWVCHECEMVFTEGVKECKACGHDRCDRCLRKPPRKNRASAHYDSDMVQKVQHRFDAIDILDQSAVAGSSVSVHGHQPVAPAIAS